MKDRPTGCCGSPDAENKNIREFVLGKSVLTLIVAATRCHSTLVFLRKKQNQQNSNWKNHMAQNSPYCKAYLAKQLRAFPGWTEKTTSLRKRKTNIDNKEVETERTRIEEDDVLYLHDCYVVTDGIFKDENIVFDSVSDEWKKFCAEQINFSIPEYRQKAAVTQPQA